MDLSPYVNDAKRIQAETGIPASIILGQMKLESSGSYGSGLSGLAYHYNNLFGIKGKGTAGSVWLPTREVVNGKTITVNAEFRKYNSAYESMLDHARLLQTDRYASQTKNAQTVEDYARGIKAGGYATDPNYVSKLMGVITGNNLLQYDGKNYMDGVHLHPTEGKPSETGGGFTPGTAPGAAAAFSAPDGFAFGVVRFLLIAGVMTIGIVFFMKAFPAVGEGIKKTAGAAINVVPAGRVATVAKGVVKGAAK